MERRLLDEVYKNAVAMEAHCDVAVSTPEAEKPSNLATVREIKSLEPIANADKIELAKFTDVCWQSVVKRGDFSVGQKVVYIQIDTILPDGAAWANFLKDKNLPGEPIRLKTVKLRGALSQGLVLPLSVIPRFGENANEDTGKVYNQFYVTTDQYGDNVVLLDIGDDITELIGVKKYEKPIPAELAGLVRGNFPTFLRKTDEERLQNYPDLLHEVKGQDVSVTMKCDGTSATYYSNNGEFGVCSRKLDLAESEGNTYWRMARELKLPDFLKSWGNVSLQGEICGPGIQSNKLGLDRTKFFLFNLWNIDEQKFFNFEELCDFCGDTGIEPVPLLYRGTFKEEWSTIDGILDFANKQVYPTGLPAEGIVVRPVIETSSQIMGSRLSFKVISNTFALKYGE